MVFLHILSVLLIVFVAYCAKKRWSRCREEMEDAIRKSTDWDGTLGPGKLVRSTRSRRPKFYRQNH